ncbi:MAG TPA: hypothetical protein VER03_24915 [Bryobacteraceae bacterium]|nr:hypothetical protein [Bryobacteraceae bacterium]
MSSAAKAIANRVNATHSTGPVDTSRTRFNGLAHGLTSKQTVIPGEDQNEYDTFASSMRKDLSPASATETFLVDRVIAAAWRLKRFTRMETAFFSNRIDAHLTGNPESNPDAALANLFTDPAEMSRMRLFLRYQNSVQKEYDTAIRELLKAKEERADEEYDATMVEALTQLEESEGPQSTIGFASQPLPVAASVVASAAASAAGAANSARYTGV